MTGAEEVVAPGLSRRGRRIAIASPHAAATAAAADAVRDGGGVLDAALAAAAVLTVVYPHNTGVAGDLFALLRTSDGRIRCVNASGPAAAATDRRALQERFGDFMPVSGAHTVTVPGAVAGWAALHDSGALLPWHRLLAPAARLARDGFPIARSLATASHELARHPEADPGLRAAYAPAGTPLTAGSVLHDADVAHTLEVLAAEGPDAFYRGGIGRGFVAGLRELGSVLTVDDLAGYAVESCEALRLPFAAGGEAYEVWTAPPNSQGFVLLQTWGALAARHGGSLPGPDDDPAFLARLSLEGNRLRDTVLADPRRCAVGVDDTLSAARLAALADRLAAGPRTSGLTVAGRAGGDTVAVSVADDAGNAVSLIQSLFHTFGAAMREPNTGLVPHNRGTCFSLREDSPNAIDGSKWPAHTLMPVLVTAGGRLRVVASTMGGRAQPQILGQVLTRVVAGAAPATALAAPRWVVGGLGAGDPDDLVLAEADVDPKVRAALRQNGWPVVDLGVRSEDTGHTQLVCLDPEGRLRPGSDPRSDGAATIVWA